MKHLLTSGAQRALARAAWWARHTDSSPANEVSPTALLMGLLGEPESRAGLILHRLGIDESVLCRDWPELKRGQPASLEPLPREPLEAVGPLAQDVRASLEAAAALLADFPQPIELATEHLLLGLVAAEHPMAQWLRAHGLVTEALDDEIHRLYGYARAVPFSTEPLDMPVEPGDPPIPRALLACPSPIPGHTNPVPRPVAEPSHAASEQVQLLRILDAAEDRAREGLRVVEDYVRFALDDRHLTEVCKSLRHELASATAGLSLRRRLASRETRADVGTVLSAPSERERRDLQAVVHANLARIQESLRSLEEFGKVLEPRLGSQVEGLRYRTYTLQRAIEATVSGHETLVDARLYVLVDGGTDEERFSSLVRALVASGVHVIQLRDKKCEDRALLERARQLRALTRSSSTRFIMNDRPDLALLAQADGVHVGQEELSVKDARAVVGPDRLIGVSTHSIEQARQAVLDGANYIGVGPTFPSSTKHFDVFPGLALARAVAAEISLPAFAIGGINVANIGQVTQAGLRRVAVSGAVAGAADPAAAAREFLDRLR